MFSSSLGFARFSLVIHRSSFTSIAYNQAYNLAYLGIGSNVGNRHHHLLDALEALNLLPGTKVNDTSFLYETRPMYVTEQPNFLNAVISLQTQLDQGQLLQHLKAIESHLGRSKGQRFGPRPIDLDIVLFGRVAEVGTTDSATVEWLEGEWENVRVGPGEALSPSLPHPRMLEREFVLRPLADVLVTLPSGLSTQRALESLPSAEATRVLPLGGRLIPLGGDILIMGIVNVTPDSFSDGGRWQQVDDAVGHGVRMAHDGAAVIDVGGESTRPGATAVAEADELARVVPVIKRLREALHEAGLSSTAISVDTRSAAVAEAAVEAGADLVNDVSGGVHDPRMLSAVKALRVPFVAMHMRGDPTTMTSPELST
jgi:2-amino-4-hydroxy-6-hydroxymethyldihydropteridine diphosphokinase